MRHAIKTPYDPLVIVLMPRWSDTVAAIQAVYGVMNQADYAIAVASNDQEARRFHDSWTITPDVPLLILRIPEADSIQQAVKAIAEMSKANGHQAVGVLLADGPDAQDYTESKRDTWNRAFAETLHKTILDSQVLEYSNTWAASPPRVR
jgi:hypothetical protein